MHPLRHPRNAALVGIVFIVIAVIYYVVPTLDGIVPSSDDIAAGTTMLLFLGVAMAIMAYVLVAGSTEE
jgi:lipopolysaccharide export LptBFGC system permease protein LptF